MMTSTLIEEASVLVQRGETVTIESEPYLDKTYGGKGCRFGVSPEVMYTDEERIFIQACERFVKKSGHRYPTFTEILAIAISLGYRKIVVAERAAEAAACDGTAA